ncbi:MAG: hypothetical protein KC417_15990 [Myxococcales bacterium]|nr:hypothetical protein [Myxococcales bacterium]
MALVGLCGFGALGDGFQRSIDTGATRGTGAAAQAGSPASVGRQAALAGVAGRLASSGGEATKLIKGLALRFPESAVGRMVSDGSYFKLDDFLAAHVRGARYHDAVHSAEVSSLAYDLARRRGLANADAQFLSEVGIVHDFDPARAAGSSPRVAATLGQMGDIAAHMGWDTRHRAMAEALIQRTMYPFAGAEVEKYESLVRALPAEDAAFVLREGPVLSEYADKGGNYMLRRFRTTFDKVRGLVREIDPTGKLTPRDLDTGAFLRAIGRPPAFLEDVGVAERVTGSADAVLGIGRDMLERIAPDLVHRLETNEGLFNTIVGTKPSAP